MTGQHQPLPEIPVLHVGTDWPFETLDQEFARANALLDEGGGRIPRIAIRAADALSRRWLERWHEPYLKEIDRISARIGRPGAYFLNVSYEWGCTSRAGPSPDGRTARLLRVLDWPDHGLGRHVIAAVVKGAAGPWLTLTWPGYTGVLQAVAPQRFAAALNQAPMQKPVGFYPLDWLVTRLHVWDRPHLTAAHLLRQVFERARTFAEAKALLVETPIALPAIYILSGLAADEACVIERHPESAQVIEGDACAANAWQASPRPGRVRGHENARRVESLRSAPGALDSTFEWLQPPVLNRRTRLALIADASSGTVIAQGFEADGPATAILRWSLPKDTGNGSGQ